MSNASRKESTAGEIVNLMSVDAKRLFDFLFCLNEAWSGKQLCNDSLVVSEHRVINQSLSCSDIVHSQHAMLQIWVAAFVPLFLMCFLHSLPLRRHIA